MSAPGLSIDSVIRANDDLRAENRRLRALVAGNSDVPGKWGLTSSQAALARALLDAKGRVAKTDRLLSAMRLPFCDEPSLRSLWVQMHRLRRKLSPFGIRINGVRHDGYWIEMVLPDAKS